MGRDTARGLAAGLYRETGATRRKERHDKALVARDMTPCATIRCTIQCAQGHDTAAWACDMAVTRSAWA